MSLAAAVLWAVSCVVAGQLEAACAAAPVNAAAAPAAAVAGPQRSSEALDVTLTAKAAIAWDVASQKVLYSKQVRERREVASLSKLLSALVVREHLAPTAVVAIPPAAQAAQRLGTHIKLPVGGHARVDELLAASLIASANDAIVTLAEATAGSEAAFVALANEQAQRWGLVDTKLANASGLPGGEQHSTAENIRQLLSRAYADVLLRDYLSQKTGSLQTVEGLSRGYESTNDLLDTYLPVVAAKTGYTVEAGENVAVLTRLPDGHTIGIVVLGSTQRFQDAKILAEWIHRHYRWSR
jgi:serine-type D-Ala-D-Ala carboxypeptidase (penicillin-binding protein 5/6)